MNRYIKRENKWPPVTILSPIHCSYTIKPTPHAPSLLYITFLISNFYDGKINDPLIWTILILTHPNSSEYNWVCSKRSHNHSTANVSSWKQISKIWRRQEWRCNIWKRGPRSSPSNNPHLERIENSKRNNFSFRNFARWWLIRTKLLQSNINTDYFEKCSIVIWLWF